MTKHDLVVKVAKSTRMRQPVVADVVQALLDSISDELAAGGGIELRNFGVFELAIRRSRIGQDMRAPCRSVQIPKRVVVKFKPGKVMRQRVVGLGPQGFAATDEDGE